MNPETMKKFYILILSTLALLLAAGASLNPLVAASAAGSEADARAAYFKKHMPSNGMWIVELESAPTVHFEGDVVQSVTADGSIQRKALAATAPAMTGANKLDTESVQVQEYMQYLDAERGQLLQRIEQTMGRAMQPRHVYRHVLNGFAAKMSFEEALAVAEMPEVRAVSPDRAQTVLTDAGPQWIGATRFWSGTGGVPSPNQGEGMVLGVVDTGINWESIFIDNNAPGVSPVANPRPGFLGLCSDPDVPCTGKLIGVYDFTDEGTKGQDPDSHGSHVATTALGFPLSFNLDFGTGTPIFFSTSGVAPRASLISYKACVENPDGGSFQCFNSDTNAALEQAISNQVDVVNYSIGGDPFSPWAGQGSPSTSTAEIFLNLRAAGIVPVVAAGNSGPNEATVGSPANAPWVLAAANATHNRVLANRLRNTSGGASSLPALTGLGLTPGTPQRPVVYAGDFGNALCGTGTAELGPSCGDNSGATNPFPPGTFNGEIVVCDRGVYGRIEKGRNVLAAGAGGMILANTSEQGESINGDQHCLPATHVGADDGDQLRDWLATGSNHTGELSGTFRTLDSQFGGLVNNSSSRGPAVGAPDVMKPNATAPGTDVLAAGQDGPNSIAFLSGTSMASPHIAGAALLLRKSHPGWGVDEVISALETTADASIVSQADGSTANTIDRGAGGIQVDRAARIGLYLPTTTQQFLNADPALGGDPGELNLPGISSDLCVSNCVYTRTVRALGNSTWTVTTEGDLDIQVSPPSFSLTAGQQQVLTVTINPGSAPVGEWSSGAVVLDSSNNQFVTQRLPVGALVAGGLLPDRVVYRSDTNRGRGTLEIQDAAAYPEAVYNTSPLVRPEQVLASLPQDASPTNPYNGGPGVFVQLVSVPVDGLLLHAETFASDSLDVDLFVGPDLNGNGLPDEDEEACASLSFNDQEQCEIRAPSAGNWWIMVQNFNDSVPGATDNVPFEYAVLAAENDPSLVVSGIANHPGGDLELPVYWIEPAMLEQERWLGAIGIASTPDTLANVGIVPISVTRTDENTPEITPLFEGRTETVVVPSDSLHDGIFLDVPAGTSGIEFEIEGALADVQLELYPFSEINELADFFGDLPPLPVIGTPPPLGSSAPVLDIQQTGTGWSVSLLPGPGDNSIISEGRYYLLLDNDVGAESLVEITTNVIESDRLEPNFGLYSPRDRLIFQGFQWSLGGGNGLVVWYSFDESGDATFYLSGSEPPDPTSSYYSAPLFRFTSNGVRQTADLVGEVQVMAISETQISFSWTLNGTRNAEIQTIANGQDCPIVDGEPQPYQALWFPNEAREGGASVLATENVEIWIRYYFDNSGQPRWVYGDGLLEPTLPGGKRLRVDEFKGFCIYCEESPLSFETVGVMERQFFSLTEGREVIDFVSRPPLNETYSSDRPVIRLTDFAACSN